MAVFRTIYVVLYLLSSNVLSFEFGPIIEIFNGRVQGTVTKNLNGKTFHVFEGIPYAVPPVGDDRYALPKDREDCWTGVLTATDNSHKCLQPYKLLVDPSDSSANSSFRSIGSEDCLYLNIYSPANLFEKENQLLPVLVWIHEGAFTYRSKQLYKPLNFMDYDIIVVTINYRLGVLGFLSSQDGIIPSNLGLKDQRQALRWVHKNIKQFGGDPNKVTAAGQSAGSIGISYLLLDESSAGLFRGAILESGSALCPHDFQPYPKPKAYLLGSVIDPNFKNSSKDLKKMLREISSDKLMEYSFSQEFRKTNDDVLQLNILNNVWLPVVEDSRDTDIVVPMPMHQAFIEGKFMKIPIIAGFTSEESVGVPGYESELATVYKADENPGLLIEPNLNIRNKREAGEKLKALYSKNFTNSPEVAIKFFSDNYYITPIIRQSELIQKHAPVYLYQFSYQHSTKRHLPGAERVGHKSEVQYLFGENKFLNEDDRLTHKRLIKMWTNFIKYQNPTPEVDSTIIKWTKTTSDLEYLDINRTLSILKHPYRYETWRRILTEYITKPYWIY